MKLLLYVILILNISCSPQKLGKRESIKNYSVEQLLVDQGQPTTISKNLIDEKYEMYNYDKNNVYQVLDGIVIAKYRDPTTEERDIQFWRHSLRGIYYSITESHSDTKSHSQLYKIVCPSKGLTVYFQGSGKVFRIAQSMTGDKQ